MVTRCQDCPFRHQDRCAHAKFINDNELKFNLPIINNIELGTEFSDFCPMGNDSLEDLIGFIHYSPLKYLLQFLNEEHRQIVTSVPLF